MQITVTVALGSDDQMAWTPEGAAAQVLAALGGDPTSDFCAVTFTQHATGTAGLNPDAPPVAAVESPGA